MSTITERFATVNSLPIVLSLDAVREGRAEWMHDKPIEEALAVKLGEAEWLASRPEMLCGCEDETCRMCLDHPADMSDRAEFARDYHDRVQTERIEAEGMLVDCPRCSGLGLRQLLVTDGIDVEVCSSCDGEGEVDRGTARTIAELMDLAHQASDPDAWLDDVRWVPTEPVEPRSLEHQVRDHARELRAQGSPLGDLLAEQAEQLADQIRYLEATTVEQYRDRLDAALDCAMADGMNRRNLG